MDDKNNVYTSIFDLIDDNSDDAKTNIDSGSIAFMDKSFDEFKVPKIFAPLNINFKHLKDLKYYQISEIKNIIKKNNQEKFIKYINTVMLGLESLKNNLEKIINEINDITVLYMRSNGEKLNEIGETRNLTRERIRQIENNLIEEVSLYIVTYLDALYRQGKFDNVLFYDFNDIFSFVRDERILKTIIYVINYQNEYSFALYSNNFSCYYNPKKGDLIDCIKENIKLEKYFNFFDNFSKLNNSLIYQYNILDFRINIYLNYLKNQNYLFKGNLAYIFGECSVNDIISMAIRDYYPEGIVLDDNGINELSSFINKLLNYSFKVNSALAKIDELNDELILWGKLKRIHIDNVNILPEKLELILSEFKKIVESVDYLLFEDAFNSLSNILQDTPITDKYKLYGVIKYYLNEDFYFKKMAVRKLELKNQTLTDIVYDYIDKHDMCTKDDIVAELFISKSSLFAVYREKRDIICTNTYHTLIKKLEISSEEITFLKKTLADEVKNGYCHRDVIYEKYPEKMKKYGIIDSTMFYHLTRYYFDGVYNFNSPYIQSTKFNKPVNMRNIILDIFEHNDYVVSVDEIIDKASTKTATKDFSLIYNLRISEINVFRMNKTMLTLTSKVDFDDIVKYMINNRLYDHFKKNQYALGKELKDLAKGLYFTINHKKYTMDIYSLCSYVENNLSQYYVVNSSAINNFNDANYAICKDNISFIELVYKILKENSKNQKIEKNEAIKLLKRKELMSSIPVVLVNDKYLRIDDEMLILLK